MDATAREHVQEASPAWKLPISGSPPLVDHRLATALAAAVADDDRVSFSRAFAGAVVAAFRRAAGLAPMLAPDASLAPLGAEAAAVAARLGEGVAGAAPEQATYLIGAAYTAALPSEHRARHGVFYTPPTLVGRLLEMAEVAGTDWRTARVLDPACGGGAFLIAAAGRMATALSDLEPALALRRIGERLRGFELDPFGAWLAQAMLDARLADLARRAGRPVPGVVEVRDSLDLRPREVGRFDLVVGNPPYGRVTPPPERRARFARSTYGHANLYALFTDAALHWAAPASGLVAYVTPTSMLSGLYHKRLRALLSDEAPPMALDLVAERAGVFEGVLQETMLAVYRRGDGPEAREGAIGFLALDDAGRVVSRGAGTFSLPRDPEAPWLLPRSPGQEALARRLRAMPYRLADYGYGVSTGPLVWNRHKPQFQTKRDKDSSYPVVWAEAVSPDGRFTWRAERRGHAPWFAADLPRDKWLLVDRPCVLLQRTTAKEQARRLIAAELPRSFLAEHGAAVIENHLNMVRPVVPAPTVPSAAVAALLNSAAADAAFRCISGSVAVSAFELEAMPVPPPAVMAEVVRLLGRGAAWAEVEAVIAAAYRGEAGNNDRADAAAA